MLLTTISLCTLGWLASGYAAFRVWLKRETPEWSRSYSFMDEEWLVRNWFDDKISLRFALFVSVMTWPVMLIKFCSYDIIWVFGIRKIATFGIPKQYLASGQSDESETPLEDHQEEHTIKIVPSYYA